MKSAMGFLTKALVRGLLIVVPVYFAVLLLLKGMKTVAKLVSPFAQMLPEWLPAEDFLSLLLVLAICVAIGASVGTGIGGESETGSRGPSLNESRAMGSSRALPTR